MSWSKLTRRCQNLNSTDSTLKLWWRSMAPMPWEWPFSLLPLLNMMWISVRSYWCPLRGSFKELPIPYPPFLLLRLSRRRRRRRKSKYFARTKLFPKRWPLWEQLCPSWSNPWRKDTCMFMWLTLWNSTIKLKHTQKWNRLNWRTPMTISYRSLSSLFGSTFSCLFWLLLLLELQQNWESSRLKGNTNWVGLNPNILGHRRSILSWKRTKLSNLASWTILKAR